jgi:hypothetical protein
LAMSRPMPRSRRSFRVRRIVASNPQQGFEVHQRLHEGHAVTHDDPSGPCRPVYRADVSSTAGRRVDIGLCSTLSRGTDRALRRRNCGRTAARPEACSIPQTPSSHVSCRAQLRRADRSLGSHVARTWRSRSRVDGSLCE